MEYVTPLVRGIANLPPAISYFPEGAGQNFKRGDFVKLSGGKLVSCVNSDTQTIGMAIQDAYGEEDRKIAVALAVPYNQFILCIGHSDPQNAVTSINDVGQGYGIYISDGKTFVGKHDTANKFFKVLEIYPSDEVGTQYGRIVANVIDDVSQVR